MNRLQVPPLAPPQPAGPWQSAGGSVRVAGDVAVVVLARWRRDAGGWGLLRLARQLGPLRGVPGLGFAKVLGSGLNGGFGLVPGLRHHGLFVVFDGEAAALAFAQASPLLAAYRAHAAELAVVVLRAAASRGSWSGVSMAVSAGWPAHGPVASLTRASIRMRHAAAFWRLAPPAEKALASAPGCRLAAGLGEAPVLRQATFSLWDDVASMDAYARHGAHHRAIRAAYDGGYFRETMFVRLVPVAGAGQWQGCDLGRL